MLGGKKIAGLVRAATAASLALLLSFAALAPLDAFSDPTPSCCRGGMKCCCRKGKSQAPDAPAYAKRCCDGCRGAWAPGSAGINGLVRPPLASSAPAIIILPLVSGSTSSLAARLDFDALRQRPPPVVR